MIGGRSIVFKDFLKFILLFPIDRVREWHRVINTVSLILMTRSQKKGIEDWVDLPGMKEVELI